MGQYDREALLEGLSRPGFDARAQSDRYAELKEKARFGRTDTITDAELDELVVGLNSEEVLEEVEDFDSWAGHDYKVSYTQVSEVASYALLCHGPRALSRIAQHYEHLSERGRRYARHTFTAESFALMPAEQRQALIAALTRAASEPSDGKGSSWYADACRSVDVMLTASENGDDSTLRAAMVQALRDNRYQWVTWVHKARPHVRDLSALQSELCELLDAAPERFAKDDVIQLLRASGPLPPALQEKLDRAAGPKSIYLR